MRLITVDVKSGDNIIFSHVVSIHRSTFVMWYCIESAMNAMNSNDVNLDNYDELTFSISE